MMLLSPATDALFSFLATYLIHSSLLALLIALGLHCWQNLRPEMRISLWKLALVGPVISSLVVSLGNVPSLGFEWTISSSMNAPDTTPSSVQSPETSAGLDSENRFSAISHRDNSNPAASEAASAGTLEIHSHQAIEEPVIAEPQLTVGSMARFVFCVVCLVGSCLGCLVLLVQVWQIQRLRAKSQPVLASPVKTMVDRLCRKAGLRGEVPVLESSRVSSPFTAGVLFPFIVIPADFLKLLRAKERAALFAHELAHIARRDNLWKVVGELVCRVFFFQLFNRAVFRRLQIETEFVADERAAELLQERTGLALCLTKLCEWWLTSARPHRPQAFLGVGMAAFRSNLGRRIECLLEAPPRQPAAPILRATGTGLVAAGFLLLMAVAPRATANPQTTSPNQEPAMKTSLPTLAMLASLTFPVAAEENDTPAERPAITKTTPDEFPEGAANLRGMLVGRLVKKDVEKGTFLVNVDAVPRVWQNNQAKNPKSLVGKNIEVNGVFGKFLDVLLLIKEGETLEFEARHDRGQQLTFPGELLRKVAPFKAEDYPVLPEGFRGFRGAVSGKILKKDPNTFELIVQVDKVIDTWKNNEAENPKSIEGKTMMLAGFWQRKEAYYGLQEGDRIETGLQHIGRQSDHLTVAEFVRKAGQKSEEEPKKDRPRVDEEASAESETGFPSGMRGFRGVLVGKLVSKDIEKGQFTVEAENAPRVWPKNEARSPESCKGKQFTIQGVTGRFLDVLIVVKTGERLEFGAMHNRGELLDFPGELLKKLD